MTPNDNHILKKRAIIDKYNSTSLFYDRRYAEIQEEKYNYFIKSSFINPKSILDAGCGTGLLIVKLLDILHPSILTHIRYIGLDISQNMLKAAKTSIHKRKLKGGWELILADLEHLPFRSNEFDCIFSITSLQNLYDVRRSLLEMVRTSKNGTNLYISVLKKGFDRENLLKILQKYCKIVKIEEQAGIEDVLISGSVKKT